MESNLDILFEEMVQVARGPQEKQYHEEKPQVEKAMSLEELFNGFT